MGLVSKRLRESARGRDCTLQIFGVCNHDPATTVLAHLPGGDKGMAIKGHDWNAVFSCSSCHAALDEHKLLTAAASYSLHALQKTIGWWIENGYLTIAGDAEPKPRATSKKSLPPKKLIVSGSPGGKS